MGKIAIAGGTVGIGRSIADALDSTKTDDYIILSRRPSGPETRAVDYSDIKALTELFEIERVDTVISTIAINDDQCGQAQLNLISAADKAASVKRFLPSEFGMFYTKNNIAHIPSYSWKLKASEALEKTNLEFSLVSIGMFLDYWSTPRILTRLANAANVWLDAENNVAVIPGDGDAPLVLTHSSDAGKYVAALLGVTNWSRRYFVVGNRTTLNQAVKLAEEVKGVKFDVHHESLASLQSGEVTLTPRMQEVLPQDGEILSGFKAIIAGSGLGIARGDLDLNPNDGEILQFPGITALSLRDVFQAWL